MNRKFLAAVAVIAFVSGQAVAHDDLKSKAQSKPKPEASKDDKKGDYKGKDHDKKH